jgi:hypothetical protein
MPQNEFAKDSTFPKVKFKVVRDTGKAKHGIKLFQFWDKLPAEKQELVVVKIYRLWPICDLKAIDPRATIEWDTMRGKIPFPAEEYETAFMHKYGSGEWKVMLTESGVQGAVMIAFFSAIDMDNYPPLLDYRTLLHGNFKNQDYIKWLERQPGLKLPWTSTVSEAEEQEQQDKMNVADKMADGLLSQQAHLIDKLDEAHEELRTTKRGPTAEEAATNKAVEVMADAASRGIGMVADQAKILATATAPSFDPVALFKVGMEARGSDSGIMALVPLILSSQEKQTEAMRQMHHETIEFLSKRDEEDDAPAPANGNVPAVQEDRRSFMSEMKEMTEFAEMMGFKRGAENPPAPAGAGWLDKIGSAIAGNPMIVIAGLALVTNLLSKSPQSATEVLAKAGVPAGSLPPIPGVPAAATPVPPKPSATEELNKFLEFLTPHFLHHYADPELDGYTFAADIHTIVQTSTGLQIVAGGPATPRGRQEYENMKAAGIQQFDQIIRNWPGIWNSISSSSHGPEMNAYTKFLREFFDYDRWAQQQVQPKVTTMRPS